MVKENLTRVKERIKAAAERVGRDLESVKIVVVTKEAKIDQVREAVEAGVADIGENRVKEALLKRNLLNSHVLAWHMIGHLQSNKVREAVRIFSLIHSVDSVRLAYILDREAAKNNKVQDILLEVNVSGEGSKFGIKPNDIENFLEETRSLKHLNVLGLMTMAPLVADAEVTRPYFRKLKELANAHRLKELSMGMTQDFEVAVEEGATMVRIGSAIFSA
ncbi:MAG: YggS family pyridoxal phosphate-dependent enzyme [Candidatus Omnitrophica bacterium]|nr:YggS family pyridoxal phosphate-dependent enzyme [Candidatus Omnitrophota bacterium]